MLHYDQMNVIVKHLQPDPEPAVHKLVQFDGQTKLPVTAVPDNPIPPAPNILPEDLGQAFTLSHIKKRSDWSE
jgi:hypothetical protein